MCDANPFVTALFFIGSALRLYIGRANTRLRCEGSARNIGSLTFSGSTPPFATCRDFDLPLESSSVIIPHIDTPFSSGSLINILVSADASIDFEEPS
jgi:hypothetical protein